MVKWRVCHVPKIGLTILLIIFVLLLSGCGHEHTWIDATCTEPATCSECGETDGEALGHKWTDATCTEPATCSVCGEANGDALGHTWIDATCTEPAICSVCGETNGDALGHTWVDATCTEPAICSVCGETDGEPLGHDTPELTCTNDTNCTRCGELILAPGHQLTEATCTDAPVCTVCGEVVGEPLGHTTLSGTCARCGAEIYPTEVPDVFLEFLELHTEYQYYSLLDINGDGIPELFATDQVLDDGSSYANPVDLYVWKNGEVILVYDGLWSKYEPLSFNEKNEWIVCGDGGTGIQGYNIVYLDENLETQSQSFAYGEDDNGQTHYYYNEVDITDGDCEAYTAFLEQWDEQDDEVIIFEPVHRNKVSDSAKEVTQVWTITKKSNQCFTEYREITYTKEWEVGTVHTLLPVWEIGDEVK